MLNLTNYQILNLIYESPTSLVYRGFRHEDNQPVVLKLPKSDYPTPTELARYHHEYDLLKELNLDRVIKVYGLEQPQNTLVLMVEDFGGESLKKLFMEKPPGKVDIAEFLPLAIAIADSLGKVHAANIMHKDINPSNLIYNPTTKQLKIIDFGIASRFVREMPTLKNPNQLEGTLAYLSPEQTGRMNRVIDYRTDLYSLGATFYELLTGQLPFNFDLPVELVHSHLAKTPPSVQAVNPNVPPILSTLVMKLLAKNAEDRYQSATGLKWDLEKCLEHYRDGLQESQGFLNLPGLGNLQESQQFQGFLNLQGLGNLHNLHFELAQHDFSGKFQIPQKLYGRDQEIQSLLQAFARVSLGTAELMLVAGYSGVGKTALVHEVHKPMTAQNGYFATGKFDQYQRNIPYFALTQAFNQLCDYWLTESPARLHDWQQKILTAVGANGQVLIAVIPHLELVIGPQPAIVHLGPQEAQNRFHLVFQNFFQVICQPNHPFVLFIDDLQWADLASLTLLKQLLTTTESRYFLIIGAYRDNEVDATHPLRIMLEDIHNNQVSVTPLHLPNLSRQDVDQLLTDALSSSSACRVSVLPLSQLVYEKTQGNAFFTTEFLKSLYDQQLMTFDWSTQQWQWDLDKIAAQGMTDNVVDLMAGKLEKLPVATQTILKLAACIGNQFDLETLWVISQDSFEDMLTTLLPAVSEGFLVPLDDRYQRHENSQFKFYHDRIQQAAYSLIKTAAEKQNTHLQIGRLLFANLEEEQLADKLFDVVNQFNQGLALVTDATERLLLAGLNLKAGQKAKTATAYPSALSYLQTGIQLLADNAWQPSYYELTLTLYNETAETAYLCGQFELAERLLQQVLQQAKTVLDKVKGYEIRMQMYISQNQMQAAIDTGLQALDMLGVSLSDSPPPNLVIADLEQLPPMTDPEKLAAMRLLMKLLSSANIVDLTLTLKLVFSMINTCINHGSTSLIAFACVSYSAYLCAVAGDLDTGYQFGKLALKLLEQFETFETIGKVHLVFNDYIRHWKEPVRNAIEPLRKTIYISLGHGDIEYASYAAMSYCATVFRVGENLAVVTEKQILYLSLIRSLHQEYQLYYTKIWGQLVLNLRGFAKEKQRLTGELFNEAEIPSISRNANTLFSAYLAKTILCYLFKNSAQAVAFAAEAAPYEKTLLGLLSIPEYCFYSSLALLAHYPMVNPNAQQESLEKVTTNQHKMKLWAGHAPMNFQHRYDLVEAETARVLGQLEAIDWYEKAIRGARENGYLQDQALAYELAAEFYLGRGMEKIAQTYLREAHYDYQQWGAMAKVADLEERYPQFLLSPRSPQLINPLRTFAKDPVASLSDTYTTSTLLDLESVIKASQTLSGEIVLDQLLAKMMQIVIENAGAERGILLLPKQDNWFIEAEGQVGSTEVQVLQSIFLENHQYIATAVVHYVARTHTPVVLDNAAHQGLFTHDPYIVKQRPKSVLCAPLKKQGQLTGLLYLENNLIAGAFTADRFEVINLLSSQIAIAIENAKFYAKLHESERTLMQFLEAMPVGVAVLKVNGKLSYANQRAAQIAGKEFLQDVAGEQLSAVYQMYKGGTHQLYPPEELPIIRALRGESSTSDDMEFHPEGKIIPIEAWGTPIFDDNGQVAYAITAFQDITERKQAEANKIRLVQEQEAKQAAVRYSQDIEAKNQELANTLQQLRATQQQLIESEKMAALGNLVAGVAHEINTPIGVGVTAASGLDMLTQRVSTLYAEGKMKRTDFEDYLKNAGQGSALILKNLYRAAELIRSFKQVAVDQTGEHKRTFNLKHYLHEILLTLQPELKHTPHQATIDCQADLTLTSYPGVFSQIITNLVMNSLLHGFGKTPQVFETAQVTAGKITITAQTQNQHLTLRYSDNGKGIPADIINRIFEPFFTTNPQGGGCGLGLHIVYNLVTQKLKGTIRCESIVGQGTTFIIEMPIS
jgi:PAS domain S-box-containing protein